MLRQFEHEQIANQRGVDEALAALQKRADRGDYSRSPAGQKILKGVLAVLADAIDVEIKSNLRRRGVGADDMSRLYKLLTACPVQEMPLLDASGAARGGCKSEHSVDVWDTVKLGFIALVTVMDLCRLELNPEPDNHSHIYSGKRYLPTNYELEKELGNRLQDQLHHDYVRKATRGTGIHWLMDAIVESSRTGVATVKQQRTTSRREINQKIEEFEKAGLSPVARVLGWKPFTYQQRTTFAAKLISLVNKALEAALKLEGPALEIVDRFKAQYYSLTDEARERLDQIDHQALEGVCLPQVMLIQPMPHTPSTAGGYLGAGKALIPSTTGNGWNGEFRPSVDRLRSLNAAQNVGYRVNTQILEVMQELERRGQSQEPFHCRPSLDDYVTVSMPPKVDNPTEQQQQARDTARDQRKGQFSAFHKHRKAYDRSAIAKTIRLAEESRELKSFWIPLVLDFRGRFYSTNFALNPQGMSHQKALLKFADAVPVDDRTEYHLQVGIAGAAGLDKKTYEERTQWFRDHRQVIVDMTSSLDAICDRDAFWRVPKTDGLKWDDQWAFLALCLEWRRLFVDRDEDQTTGIIVTRDATCSGGQLIGGLLTSGATAKATNLIRNGAEVFDIYQNTYREMQKMIKDADLFIPLRNRHGNEITDANGTTKCMKISRVKQLLKKDPASMGAVRKAIKKAFLPKLYGAGHGKCIGELKKEYRFGHILDQKSKAARLSWEEAYGVGYFFEAAVAKVIPALGEYVAWAHRFGHLATHQEIKGADGTITDQLRVDENGVPVMALPITIPDGSQMILRYPKKQERGRQFRVDHITTHSLFDPREKHRQHKGTTILQEMDHKDMVKALPPNLIHALDAFVIGHTVNNLDSLESNVPVTIIHDCIGLPPGRALEAGLEFFKAALLAAMTSGYLDNAMASCDVTQHPVPRHGSFDPLDVVHSSYSIC
ncbi:DNA-directed RNA polymerase [Synechococcus sp. MU1643]|uniref:DNA-directed RNA polymerase n=1 Tax=Synechococcus sp. MU1643 TaxID=2508349 RepID=UPI001CF91664|nr:DNA-directed RNA polymerase [Synechococcus sp. MU1643]